MKQKKYKEVIKLKGVSKEEVIFFLDLMSKGKGPNFSITLKAKVIKDGSINLRIIISGTDPLSVVLMRGYFMHQYFMFRRY